ncbi:unnamed protein product [Brachionus calyciflorus]|uniref:Little elongation complex subunit 2 C-terminal domain-containing protein n=1 Tax=Brachionus calyciflorus TaxID=104777 RepID=A0A814GLT0_9BILA|nr:unnamed protein product [Brachionus calyciflorus]
MFFSDENNFEKYSIFGNPDNFLKLNEFKNDDSKFDFLPFLKLCDYDLEWYDPLLDTLSDKHHKLVNPNLRQIQEFEYRPVTPTLDEPITVEEKIEINEMKPSETPKPNSKPQQNKPVQPTKKGPELATPDSNFDRRTFNLMKFYYPLKFKLPYPKRSHINSYEQKEFIELHLKFRNRVKVTQSEVKFYKKYLHLKLQVEKERNEFYSYLKDYYTAAGEDYEFLDHSIEPYVNDMLTSFNSDSYKFERFYSKIYDINMSQLDVNNQYKTMFQFERNLVQLGHLQKVIIPSIPENNQPNLIIDCNKLSNRYPVSKKGKNKSKIPLNEDKNAERLALKYNCNIVMTNSAFVYLVYNLSFTNSDELKIVINIKEFEDKDGKKQKVIFIEKPFVDKHLSKREINEKFYKRSLFVTLVKHQPGVHRSKVNKTLETPQKESQAKQPEAQRILEKLNVDYNIVSSFESFGVTSVESNLKNSEEKLMEKINENVSESNVEELIVKNSDNISEKIEENSEEKQVEKINENENILLPTPFSTVEQPVEKLKKRNRLSNDSNKSFTTSKKLKADTSSDYEDYGSDDEMDSEENGLVIADNTNNDTVSRNENLTDIKKEIINSEIGDKNETKNDESIEEPDEPKSPTPENNLIVLDFIPKVIPLEKPNNSNIITEQTPLEKEKQSKFEETKKLETPEDKLSLFDLISKLQDKLVEQPVKTENNQPHQTHPNPSKASQFPAENPREYDYIENVHDNLNYTLWTLNSNPPMKILIRYSTDGYINTEHSSMNSVVIHPKLEYQPQFGCEKLSTKDYCKMWAKSYLRNFCDIFLCRINVFTHKLLSVDKIAYDNLLPKDLEFNTNQTLNHLRNLLQNLYRLEKGFYLINKQPNWSKFDILKSVQGQKA